MEITLAHATKMRDLCEEHSGEKFAQWAHEPSKRNKEVSDSAAKTLLYWEGKVKELS